MSNRRDLPEVVEVARILRPHGIRGEVGVQLYSDHPERLAPGSVLRHGRGRNVSELMVATSRRHKNGFLVRFQGLDRRDDVEALRGVVLEVSRDQVPEAAEGTYYFFELVGCQCRDRVEGRLGVIVDVIEDGGGLLLAVEDDQRQLLIPFVREFLVAVDVEAGSVQVDLPPGLLEICGSES